MQYDNKILCDEFSREIWKYIDRSLPGEEFSFWTSHLAVCSLCRAKLNETEQVLSIYENQALEDISDEKFEEMILKASKKRRFYLRLPSVHLSKITTAGRSFHAVFNRIALSTASLAVVVILFFVFHKPGADKILDKPMLHFDSSKIAESLANIAGGSSQAESEGKSTPDHSDEVQQSLVKPVQPTASVRHEWKDERTVRKLTEIDNSINRIEPGNRNSSSRQLSFNQRWNLNTIALSYQIEKLRREVDDSSL